MIFCTDFNSHTISAIDYHIRTHAGERVLCILGSIHSVRTQNELTLRKFIEATSFMARTGCSWLLLPVTYGAWRSIHQRFMRWNRKKYLEHCFEKYRDLD